MKKRPKKPRIPLPSPNGVIDEDAPHWKGDTAEELLHRRRIQKQQQKKRTRKSKAKSSRGKSRRVSADPETDDERRKVIRRLERVLPKRKTLAAKQRLEQRIEQLRAEIGQ